MNCLKRAYYHTIRKKGKTVLLFTVLLIMATLMLTCLSIYSATDDAARDVRKSLMGSFTINAKQLNTGLGADVVQEVLTIEGVTDNYVLRSYTQATFKSENDSLMKITTQGAANIPEGYENAGKIVGNSYSEKDSYFTEAGFELIQGEAITPQQKQATIIHKDFADSNSLEVGDYFTLENVIDGKKSVRVQVVGIFTSNSPQDAIGVAPSYDLYQNVVFTDIKTCSQLIYGTSVEGSQYGDFYAEDPEKLPELIEKTKLITGMDWDNCIITKYDKDYQNAKAALTSLQNIVVIAIVVIAIVSVLILTLILVLWIRNRVYEIGVFLAMGITKANILLQQIFEVIIAAVPAFLISYGTSKIIAQMVTDRLIQGLSEDLSVSVSITPIGFAIVSGIGLALAMFATALSAYPIMRAKPKNILTQIN